jgi:hypothetical protein
MTVFLIVTSLKEVFSIGHVLSNIDCHCSKKLTVSFLKVWCHRFHSKLSMVAWLLAFGPITSSNISARELVILTLATSTTTPRVCAALNEIFL